MRIRTDGDYSHRKDDLEALGQHYDCNKTRAVLLAADQIPSLHHAIERVLQLDSLTLEQRREIAGEFERARGINVEVSADVFVTVE